ncbi:hypothetical protein EJG51_012620 [Undibacterium piscinae]|uniref:Uncharacterized protein n=1 Tax=Undibacterium piscinae TaxID=2495591 RepID=A0A6M4A5B4_9BURK|nr:hypothetical protein EJG51_012620 [Undibacterium piscinae]
MSMTDLQIFAKKPMHACQILQHASSRASVQLEPDQLTPHPMKKAGYLIGIRLCSQGWRSGLIVRR